MSKARKCDRCGRFYVPSTKARMLFEYYVDSSIQAKNGGDVCGECAEKFAKWWNKPKKEGGDD